MIARLVASHLVVAREQRDLQVRDVVLWYDADFVLSLERNQMIALCAAEGRALRENALPVTVASDLRVGHTDVVSHVDVSAQGSTDSRHELHARHKVLTDHKDGRPQLLISVIRIRHSRHFHVVRERECEVAEFGHLDHLAYKQILLHVPAKRFPYLLRHLLVCEAILVFLIKVLHDVTFNAHIRLDLLGRVDHATLTHGLVHLAL